MKRSLQNRLAALESSVKRSQDEVAVAVAVDSTHHHKTDFKLEHLGFNPIEIEDTVIWVRKVSFDIMTSHGNAKFLDWLDTHLEGLLRASRCVVTDTLYPQQFVFYDTESSGLGTGAGTFPFLHAVGQFEDNDDFVVYQYFLHDFSVESVLLQYILDHHFTVETTVGIVTFNGKSFDWPLLQTRLTMHRLKPPEYLHHIDLLHPSRRLWRQTLLRVGLANLEQSVLNLHRVDDLPGKEAPARYFAYVAGEDEMGLLPVLEHNAMDVCSLVTLGTTIADILAQRVQVKGAGANAALGKWYDEWRDSEVAARCYQNAATFADITWQNLLAYSLNCKRRGDFFTATEIWTDMLRRFPWTVTPAVELAKYAEHRLEDYESAKRYTVTAIRRVQTAATADMTILQALQHRLNRIERKRQK